MVRAAGPHTVSAAQWESLIWRPERSGLPPLCLPPFNTASINKGTLTQKSTKKNGQDFSASLDLSWRHATKTTFS